MQNKKIVILGTGGTIAGQVCSSSGNASNNIDYTAAQLGVSDLVGAIAGLNQIETE